MTTLKCACNKDALYIDMRGELACEICPIKSGLDAIKITDVPRLLAWARRFIAVNITMSPDSVSGPYAAASDLQDIIESPFPTSSVE